MLSDFEPGPSKGVESEGWLIRLIAWIAPWFHFLLVRNRLAPKPAEFDAVHDYLQSIVLDPPASRYVKQAGRAPDELVRRTVRVLPEDRQGGDQMTAQIAGASSKSRLVRNVAGLLSKTRQAVVLLGEAGSGKTRTLQQTALELAEKGQRRVRPLVPIFVHLGQFRSATFGAHESLWDLIARSAPTQLRPHLSTLRDEHRLVVLFDSVDEMERKSYVHHLGELSRFVADNRPVRCLFACRINDFSPELRCRMLVLQTFSDRQILEFVQKNLFVQKSIGVYFPLEIEGRPYSPRELRRRLLGAGDALGETARNPQILALICEYLKKSPDHAWPRSRAELFGFYISQFHKKLLDRRPDDPRFADKGEIIGDWAELAHRMTADQGGVYLNPRTLRAEWADERVDRAIDSALESGLMFLVDLKEKDLRLLSSLNDEGGIPTEGKSLVVVATVEDALHFRVFDGDGVMVVDTNETILIEKAREIGDLRKELKSLSIPNAPTSVEEKARVIAGVTSIVGAANMGQGEAAVRFAHHRFQEFLTARHLAFNTEAADAVDWVAVVDSPRWQETLLILISMDEGPSDALDVLQATMKGVLRSTGEESPKEGWAIESKTERDFADRVEFASRVIRELGRERNRIAGHFRDDFENCVNRLATVGRPTTQVKMLWAWNNTADFCSRGALKVPLESEIDWVRGQAIAVVSNQDGMLGGDDLPSELSIDLAKGLLFRPRRFRAYLDAVRGRPRQFAAFVWAMICQALFFAGVLVVGYASLSITQALYPIDGMIARLVSGIGPSAVVSGTFLVAVALGAIAGRFQSLPFLENLAWLGMPWWRRVAYACWAMGILIFLIHRISEWAWAWPSSHLAVFLTLIYPAISLGILIACIQTVYWGVHVLQRGFFAKNRNAYLSRTIHETALRNSGLTDDGGFVGTVFFTGILLFLAGEFIKWWQPWMPSSASSAGEVTKNNEEHGIWYVIQVCTVALVGIAGLIGGAVQLNQRIVEWVWSYSRSRKHNILKVALVYSAPIIALAGLTGVLLGIDAFLKTMHAQGVEVTARPVLLLIILIGIGAIILLSITQLLWLVGRQLKRPFSEWTAPRTARHWSADFTRTQDPEKQFDLLRLQSVSFRGISAERQLEELIRVETCVRNEPAASEYWRKRHELEQSLRQERKGAAGPDGGFQPPPPTRTPGEPGGPDDDVPAEAPRPATTIAHSSWRGRVIASLISVVLAILVVPYALNVYIRNHRIVYAVNGLPNPLEIRLDENGDRVVVQPWQTVPILVSEGVHKADVSQHGATLTSITFAVDSSFLKRFFDTQTIYLLNPKGAAVVRWTSWNKKRRDGKLFWPEGRNTISYGKEFDVCEPSDVLFGGVPRLGEGDVRRGSSESAEFSEIVVVKDLPPTVYAVNGLALPMELRIDQGKPIVVEPLKPLPLAIAAGSHQATFRYQGRSVMTVQLDINAEFLKRHFDVHALKILNPMGAAVLRRRTTTFDRNSRGWRPGSVQYFHGKPIESVDSVRLYSRTGEVSSTDSESDGSFEDLIASDKVFNPDLERPLESDEAWFLFRELPKVYSEDAVQRLSALKEVRELLVCAPGEIPPAVCSKLSALSSDDQLRAAQNYFDHAQGSPFESDDYEEFLNAGFPTEGVQRFLETGRAKRPVDVELHRAWIEFMRRRGNIEAPAAYYNSLPEREQNDSRVLSVVAEIQPSIKARLEYAEKAIKADVRNAHAWIVKCEALDCIGEFDKARVACDEAVRLSPYIWDWRTRRLDLDLALADFTRLGVDLSELDRDFGGRYYSSLVRTLVQVHDHPDAARKSGEEALKRLTDDPKNPVKFEDYRNSLVVLERMGLWDSLRTIAGKVKDNHWAVVRTKVLADLMQGHLDQAESQTADAYSNDDHAVLHLLLSILARQDGQSAKADAWRSRAIEAFRSTNEMVYRRTADLLGKERPSFEDANDLALKPHVKAVLFVSLAQVSTDPKEMVEFLNKAMTLKSRFADWHPLTTFQDYEHALEPAIAKLEAKDAAPSHR
jgi:tetratricopeptide (TPR) repeat protein